MVVIKRAPHEFKIACLEVTSGTQNYVTVQPRNALTSVFLPTFNFNFLFCRISKGFSLLIIIHSMRDLAIETQMNLVTGRLESQRAKYSSLTRRCAFSINIQSDQYFCLVLPRHQLNDAKTNRVKWLLVNVLVQSRIHRYIPSSMTCFHQLLWSSR